MHQDIIDEREAALAILETKMPDISVLYKECYLSKGRGMLKLYANYITSGLNIGDDNYLTKAEALSFFDDQDSITELNDMIKHYNPKTEGILMLICQGNASWFITCKLKG